ncbi:MAG: hypothetical protein JWO89_494 [Verrucomicrobiaceae bacterium]|nr:hypothetical protein [Verrucomicrobiaceae bacterium]
MKRWLTLLALVTGVAAGQDTPQPPPAQEQPEIVDQTSPAGTPPAASAADPAAPATEPAPPVPGNDKAIPQAYSEEHYAATWSRNPFLIATTAPAGPAPGPGFAEDWELKGLTRDKGQPEALLSNKKTQEIRWVKTTEDKDGFKLLKANIDRDMHKSSVEVAKAGEPSPATFTFPEAAAAPNAGGVAPARPAPGMPQMQGQGAGRVGVPGQTAANVQRGGAGMMPQNQNMGGNNAPRMNPGVQNGGNIPRMNPGVKQPNGIMSVPGNQPSPPGRRRVLIPSSPPAS